MIRLSDILLRLLPETPRLIAHSVVRYGELLNGFVPSILYGGNPDEHDGNRVSEMRRASALEF